MDAYTFTHEFFLKCDELPPVEQIMRATHCTPNRAHDVRLTIAREYDLRSIEREWPAAQAWLNELRKRRLTGRRTDIKPESVAVVIRRSPRVAAAAVRIVAKLEHLQRVVQAQRASA